MITVEISPRGIATMLMNRPAQHNRIDGAMLAAMGQAIEQLTSDAAVRVVLLRGAGKHFCAGADVNWHADNTGENPGFAALLLKLEQCPKPMVAVAHGACIGGGVALVACCDIVLATEDAFFALPEVRLGLHAGAITQLVLRAIGLRAFRRYALTGERMPAAEAHRLGLVHDVVAPDGAEASLAPILDALLLGAPGAQARTKQLAAELADTPFDPAGMLALDAAYGETLAGAEAREGLASFRAKRQPSWMGNR
jgi:methylglutaconyl-CoA hydratase